jgi:S1-C subfamily serine protease
MPEEESAQTEAPLILGEAFEDDGALITEIVPFSPAALAGLNVGDVVLAVDGVAVEAEADLATLIRAYAPGDSVVLAVRNLNSEAMREVEATLDASPQDATLPFLGVRYGMLSSMMTPDVPMPEMTPQAEEEMEESVTPEAPAEERGEGLMPGVIGALVVEVVPGGPAESAGVIAGDIISAVDGVAITGDADLAELIGDYAPGDEISLTITGMMGQRERTLPVTLGERADEPGKALLGVQYTPFTGGGMRVMPFFDQDTMPMPFGELDSQNLPENFEEFLDQLREQLGDDFNPENFEWLPPEFLNPDQFQPEDGQESL